MKPIYRVPDSIVMQKEEYVWDQICVNDFCGPTIPFLTRILTVDDWRIVGRSILQARQTLQIPAVSQ